MEFQILGPLEVRHEGTPVALGAAKQRALLAILLIHANELVSSDRLIEELWPKPPRTAANALQVYVGKLRKALEPERAHRTLTFVRDRSGRAASTPTRPASFVSAQAVLAAHSESANTVVTLRLLNCENRSHGGTEQNGGNGELPRGFRSSVSP